MASALADNSYIGTVGGLLAGLYCGLARVPPPPLLTITNLGDSLGKYAGSAVSGHGGRYRSRGSRPRTRRWILIRLPGRRLMNNRYSVNLLFGIIGGSPGGIGVFSEIVFEPSALFKLHGYPASSRHARDCIAGGYRLFIRRSARATMNRAGPRRVARVCALARISELISAKNGSGGGPRPHCRLSIVYSIASGPLPFFPVLCSSRSRVFRFILCRETRRFISHTARWLEYLWRSSSCGSAS